MITRNSVRCNKCKTDIESKNRYHYVACACGNIAVDGGSYHIRRVGLGLWDDSYIETSEFLSVKTV